MTTLPGHRVASPSPAGAAPNPPARSRSGPSPATRLPALIVHAPAASPDPRADEWSPADASSEPRREDSYAGKPPRPDAGAARPVRRAEPEVDEARATGERRAAGAPLPDLGAAIDEARVTGERLAIAEVGDRRGTYQLEDTGVTDPSLPRFELPSQPGDEAAPPPGNPRWASGLAARIDAAMHDEWSNETPVVPPTGAELRALLGVPDPTRQQSLDELEALHRAVEELPSEPELLVPRRPPHPTAEVDPDQIEAAIELAPPARRAATANTIAAARSKAKKKPE
jgi:hypothetical protein